MAIEDDLRQILTTYPKGVYVIDTLTISHSDISKTYYLTLEPEGIVIDGIFYEPANFDVSLNTEKSDLDEIYTFTISDPENKLDDELDLIPLNTNENISIVYKAFNSDDLSEPSRVENTEVISVSQEKGRFSAVCGYRRLNDRRTGVEQDYDLFPMLKAVR